jgi:O-antigen/teichoic acid export membrane protein
VKGRLAKTSMRTTFMLCLRVGTQAVTLIILSRLLAPSAYGSYAAAASLAVVLGTLPSFGSGYILLTRAARDKDAAADTWRYAWPLTLLFGTLLILAYMGIGCYVTRNALVPLSVLFFLGVTELTLNPLIILLSFIMQGCDKVATSQFLQWLPLILRAAAALACFNLDMAERLPVFTALQMVASLLGLVIALAIARRHVDLTWNPRFITWQELRLGSSYAAMYLVAYNPTELDKIVAVRSLGSYAAGIYTATSRMLGAFAMPIVALSLAAQTRLIRHSKSTHRQNKRLIAIIAAIALGWGLLGTATFAAFHQVIPWLLGADYVETGKLVPWLAITMPFLSLRMAAGGILVSLGRPLGRLLFELSGAAILIAGIVLFTPLWHTLGLIYAVIGSELSMSIIGWWQIQRNIKNLDQIHGH